ncbi:TetR/AcrR family transcriptional regulator [Peterkaempfera griseoplana]|uniref:TetR/AcrR family transcriptional regulator n=1 Tax=Peterkaempfera griseoplana TaxID=66896 RepID=UPI0006E22A87|nr:TetR/AcrR family transcriptional regulator [Peterkaempfera griseoplana]
MTMKRPYHHGDLPAALLERAEQILTERGVEALSLRELARDIGVSHAAPRRHFKDKQALLDALALNGFDRLHTALRQAEEPAETFAQRLTAHATAYLQFMSANAALLDLMYAGHHSPDTSEEFTAAVERLGAGLRDSTTKGQADGEIRPGDPEQIVQAVTSAVHGVATYRARGLLSPHQAEDVLTHLIDYLLHGLSPAKPEPRKGH